MGHPDSAWNKYGKSAGIHFFLNNQPDAPITQIYSVKNSTYFGHLLCPPSGVFYCTFGTANFHAGF